MTRLLSAGAVLVGFLSAAKADVQINMQPGSQCWSYQGLDTRFYGNFAGGQALTVGIVEQQLNEKGGMEAVVYSGAQVWVNGPDGFLKDGYREADDRIIYTDKPGRYIFNLYEHGTGAAYPVFVKICASRKDQADKR
ncbi:hypothetical protein [Bradyrhizobium sp. SZCCHNPS1003]|uniref:hypothetical protein n=1 Tax=Bradyrhizobium sp. SZCCHNPS1003 TaxID=3057330 RepID=UPI0028E52CB9|nr:hypothetical protein [Bradyrhizobium sp. SZCCHNPS1003]